MPRHAASLRAGSMARPDGASPGPLPPPLDLDDERRPAGVAARVRRGAPDEGPADREASSRPRLAADPDLTVHGVARRDLVGDADAFRSARSTNGLRLGTAQCRRRHVELKPGHDKRARPRLGPGTTYVAFQRSAPGCPVIGTRAARDREALGLEPDVVLLAARDSVREGEADLPLPLDDEAAGCGERYPQVGGTGGRPEPVVPGVDLGRPPVPAEEAFAGARATSGHAGRRFRGARDRIRDQLQGSLQVQ